MAAAEVMAELHALGVDKADMLALRKVKFFAGSVM